MKRIFTKKVVAILSAAVICNFSLLFAEQNALFEKALKNHVIDVVTEGDINNDGINEYAVFSHEKGTEAKEGDQDTVRYYFNLSVFQKQGAEMKLLWTDNGSCGYYQGFLSPQNTLLGIGDMLNNGTKYLIVRFESDDSYDLLKWYDGKLVIDKEIILADGSVKEYDENNKKAGDELMFGEFSIIKENNGTKLKIAVSNMEEKVIKISGNKYIIEREGPPSDGG